MGKESGRLLKVHERGNKKYTTILEPVLFCIMASGQPATDTGAAPEPPSCGNPARGN